MKPVEEYIKEHKEFERKRDAIRKENERLIAYWESIPWWKFWKQVPFEEKRAIILRNWNTLKRAV